MDHLEDKADDFFILTEKDLAVGGFSIEKPPITYCNAKTKKGGTCKHKISCEEKYCHIHRKQFRLEKPEECPICMENIDNVNFPLKCGHWIHPECIMKWKEDICPICRSEIKFTAKERKIKKKFHKPPRENQRHREYEDFFVPIPILELIESLLRGIPEYTREEFISDFLHIDSNSNTILIGSDNDENEEFNAEEIEDFPDIII